MRLRVIGEGSRVEGGGWRVSRAVKVNVKKHLVNFFCLLFSHGAKILAKEGL